MRVVNRYSNIRIVSDTECVGDDYENQFLIFVYKVQVKWLFFWITIKRFDEDSYDEAYECFRYCTDPYKDLGKGI